MARKNPRHDPEATGPDAATSTALDAIIPPVPAPLLASHATLPTADAIEAAFVAHYRAALAREADERTRPGRASPRLAASDRPREPVPAALLAAVDELKSGMLEPARGASDAGLGSAWDVPPDEPGAEPDDGRDEPGAEPDDRRDAATRDARPETEPGAADPFAGSDEGPTEPETASVPAGTTATEADEADGSPSAEAIEPVAIEPVADEPEETGADPEPGPVTTSTERPSTPEPKSRRNKNRRPR
jgi:hypothetical protein